jgi:uncharacterized protein
MPLLFNIRHLEQKPLVLRGELPAVELELDGIDELIHVGRPLEHDLEVEQHERSILVNGRLELQLQCECVRCLKAFEQRLELADWACLLPLEGEDKVLVTNDCVDLTPYLREDILLAFPQHPLCETGCRGLSATPWTGVKPPSGANQTEVISPTWAELNKLKL